MHRIALSSAAAAFLFAATATPQSASTTYFGSKAGDNFGFSVASAGDCDNDGVADLVVGSLFGDTAPNINNGTAHVISGATGAVLFSVAGSADFDLFGRSVAGAGDVDGDGHDDIVVGAFLSDSAGTSCGSAELFSGFDGSPMLMITGSLADEQLGQSVAGAGDVDNDGFPDVAAGAWTADLGNTDNGYVVVFRGSDGNIIYTAPGDTQGAALGSSVAAAGDMNSDGFDDIVAGAYLGGPNGEGAARVFAGPSGALMLPLNGDSPGDSFGLSVAGAGDVNGDGIGDVLVGAPDDDNTATDSGMARVHSGATGAVLYTFNGVNPNDRLGSGVGGGGDVDGDGVPDLAVGIQFDDQNGTDAGAALVISGATGSVLFTHKGDSAGDNFGIDVAVVADTNGDLLADVLVGAFKDDNFGGDSGSARLFFESCGGSTAIYGAGCPGSGGFIPELRLEGCPESGNPVVLSIDQALGGTSALLLFGLGPANIQFGLCTLLVTPILPAQIVLPLFGSGPGNGNIAVGATIPPVPSTVSFAMQAAVTDGGAASFLGVAMTNGVSVTIP